MSMFICEYCLENFKSQASLLHHQKISKQCSKYKDIIFVCKNCKFTTLGIQNITKHISDNICIISADETCDDEQIPELKNRIYELEKELETERLKNSVLNTMFDKNIAGNTSIPNIPEYIETKTFIDPPPKIDNTDNISVKSDEKPKNIYKSYKVFKSNVTDVIKDPDNQIVLNRIKAIDIEQYRMRQNFGNLEQLNIIFEQEIESLKSARQYEKSLTKMKITRKLLIGALPINEYKNLIQKHIDSLTEILKKRNHQDKRVVTIIVKCLNSLDLRLLFYGNYHDFDLETDIYSALTTSIEINHKQNSYYFPFSQDDFINLFYNYGTVVIPIKFCIEKYLINKYGFNNIIYVKINQSSEEDPYSFFVLENVIKEKRYWKMDNRLNDLVWFISNNIKTYLINTFRKIYHDIFLDNEYRLDYANKSPITSKDCDQLLRNLFIVCNYNVLSAMLKNIVKTHMTHKPTDNDKFNLYRDDVILRTKLKNKKDNDLAEVVKTLFENITTEEAVDFYKLFT